jgi:hypothetical protein
MCASVLAGGNSLSSSPDTNSFVIGTAVTNNNSGALNRNRILCEGRVAGQEEVEFGLVCLRTHARTDRERSFIDNQEVTEGR